jgi:hypothetical protein
MLNNAKSQTAFALILGITFALLLGPPAVAETRVVFKATKEQVKDACDKIEGGGGVPVQGSSGSGYGCYNNNNGVLVACSDGGTCTGYLPRAVPVGRR